MLAIKPISLGNRIDQKSMKLVVVESPAKAKTIQGFLGHDYNVLSSFGHVRDLPKSKLGFDPDNNFEQQYVIPPKAKKVVSELKKAAQKADAVILATDGDREGEAIAWHLAQALGLGNPNAKIPMPNFERIVFHEITKHAIEEAVAHPRGLDDHLVDAQRARRVLDRIVGYKLSPLLWKKIARGLSAGRVQSVALRLVVDREKERAAFKAEEYWTIEAVFKTDRGETLAAQLATSDGRPLEKFTLNTGALAQAALAKIKAAPSWQALSIEEKAGLREPLPPYMTATLQQDAAARLGLTAKDTMRTAQSLYEGVNVPGQSHVGLITYMRTDSLTLSQKALAEAAKFISERFGSSYLKTRQFKNKSKVAQEAHEAIRPTHFNLDPDSIKGSLTPKQYKLYKLIWSRTLASQMSAAQVKATVVKIAEPMSQNIFEARGQVVVFDGFLKVYPMMKVKDELLPKVGQGEALALDKVEPIQHFTKPPARYSEATLVKALKDHNIGRPSTYAPTIETLYFRKYVECDEDKRLTPTDLGKAVADLLTEHFPDIVNIQFTARLEDNLDEIANGAKPWAPVIRTFYEPFIKRVAEKETAIAKKDFSEKATDKVCPECGKPLVLKFGRFGQFYSCSGWPDCKHAEPIVNKIGVKCPVCKVGDMIARKTQRGKIFYGCNKYPACKTATWNPPTGELCPSCGKPTSFRGKNKEVRCENKECLASKMFNPR